MDRTILIVAHGSPSDPEPQEHALAKLADKVCASLNGRWRVASATLAASGQLEAALASHPDAVIYPFFMAGGFFTDTILPSRTPKHVPKLAPFGQSNDLPRAAAARLAQVLDDLGWDAQATGLLIASHGSAHGRSNAAEARAFAAKLATCIPMREIRTGFLEQEPVLQDVARDMGQAICLPWFALNSGHMTQDVPAGLHAAGFLGPCLPPFIQWDSTPALIAQDATRQLLGKDAA